MEISELQIKVPAAWYMGDFKFGVKIMCWSKFLIFLWWLRELALEHLTPYLRSHIMLGTHSQMFLCMKV